jgi:hypothetical protein
MDHARRDPKSRSSMLFLEGISRSSRRISNVFAVIAATALVCGQAGAQGAIRYDARSQVWQISAGEMTYALGVNEQHALQTIYWGPRLDGASALATPKALPETASFDPSVTTTPLEYAGWGGGLSTQPALKISFPDGNRSLLLDYVDTKQTSGPDGEQMEITLRDRLSAVEVHLFYKVYAQGILARWSRIENHTKAPFTIEQAASATLNLPPSAHYEMNWLTGRWGAEWQMHTAPIQAGAYGAREPAREHVAPDQSVVCDWTWGRDVGRGGTGMVRRAGLERKLADRLRADEQPQGKDHGRLQSLRLCVSAEPGAGADDSGVLRGVYG